MNLKTIRKKQGLSIAKLSALANVPIRMIENIERNNEYKVSTAIKLVNALQITLDELCSENENAEQLKNRLLGKTVCFCIHEKRHSKVSFYTLFFFLKK